LDLSKNKIGAEFYRLVKIRHLQILSLSENHLDFSQLGKLKNNEHIASFTLLNLSKQKTLNQVINISLFKKNLSHLCLANLGLSRDYIKNLISTLLTEKIPIRHLDLSSNDVGY
jgi:hypothetical protein